MLVGLILNVFNVKVEIVIDKKGNGKFWFGQKKARREAIPGTEK